MLLLNDDIFQEVAITSESGSNAMKNGSSNSFIQKSCILEQRKMKKTTINDVVKDKDAVNKYVYCIIYADDLSLNLVKSPYIMKSV